VVHFEDLTLKKKNKDEKKNDTMIKRMIPYEGLKFLSLLFGLNDFSHEPIGPQTNNILLITWG
jgi:hypothetical protein